MVALTAPLASGRRSAASQETSSCGAVQLRAEAEASQQPCTLTPAASAHASDLGLTAEGVQALGRTEDGPLLLAPGNFCKCVVTAAPFNCFDLFSGGTLILLHIFELLIFLLCEISEVSDYVSIKHILCPAINVLIAAEKENPLGAVNNGLLFIRGHSSEVGKPAILRCPFTRTTTCPD